MIYSLNCMYTDLFLINFARDILMKHRWIWKKRSLNGVRELFKASQSHHKSRSGRQVLPVRRRTSADARIYSGSSWYMQMFSWSQFEVWVLASTDWGQEEALLVRCFASALLAPFIKFTLNILNIVKAVWRASVLELQAKLFRLSTFRFFVKAFRICIWWLQGPVALSLFNKLDSHKLFLSVIEELRGYPQKSCLT